MYTVQKFQVQPKRDGNIDFEDKNKIKHFNVAYLNFCLFVLFGRSGTTEILKICLGIISVIKTAGPHQPQKCE